VGISFKNQTSDEIIRLLYITLILIYEELILEIVDE